MSNISGSTPHPVVDARAVRRKVALRILPLVFVLYIVAYLDRANAGFAKARMQEALGFSDQQFGWGFGIFFIGYLLLEIPGALIVEHRSASRWFTRIMITWGLCLDGNGRLVRTPWQFYLARFFLGLAEAGFFPGVIVYFTHWFPRSRASLAALAGMVLGIPVSLAAWAPELSEVGSLEVEWFGWAGWQCGFFWPRDCRRCCWGWHCLLFLVDRPARRARWLTPAERALAARGPRSRARRNDVRPVTSLGQILRPAHGVAPVPGHLCHQHGRIRGLVFWFPTAMRPASPQTPCSSPIPMPFSIGWALYTLVVSWVCGCPASPPTGAVNASGTVLRPSFMTGVCLMASVVPGQPWAARFHLVVPNRSSSRSRGLPHSGPCRH